jgi:hypothetical protein
MSDALINAGHEVLWLAPGREFPGKETFLPLQNGWLLKIGPVGTIISIWHAFTRYKKELSTVDLVFTVREYDALACKLHPLFKKHPHIFFQRGDTVNIYRFNVKYPVKRTDKIFRRIPLLYYPYLQKYLLPKLDLVVVQAEFLKKILEKRLGYLFSNVKVLPNDCNIKWVHEHEGRNEYKKIIKYKRPFTPMIGFIAPLYWHGKGLDIFFKAIKILKGNLDFKAVIIGHGPDEIRIKREIQSSLLQEHLYFLGKVQGIYRYMDILDLIVIPTKMVDACPNVVLEAIAKETAILASDIDAHKAILEYPDLLFKSEDSMDLATKILMLLSDKNKYKLNIKYVKRQKNIFSFDWDKEVTSLISGVFNGE